MKFILRSTLAHVPAGGDHGEHWAWSAFLERTYFNRHGTAESFEQASADLIDATRHLLNDFKRITEDV